MPETIKQYTDYDLYTGTIEASFLSHTYVKISNFNQLSLSLLALLLIGMNMIVPKTMKREFNLFLLGGYP